MEEVVRYVAASIDGFVATPRATGLVGEHRPRFVPTLLGGHVPPFARPGPPSAIR